MQNIIKYIFKFKNFFRILLKRRKMKKNYKKCSIIHYAYKYKPWEYNLKDITKIFLTDNKNKKLKNLAKDYKKLTPNVAKFYQILKENEDKISRIENGKVKIDENAIKSLYKQTFDKGEKRKRNKTRCVYSLSMIADNSQYVIRRNGGYMGLKGGKIAAKNYLFKNKIQSVPFYSKNVLPKKIGDILII